MADNPQPEQGTKPGDVTWVRLDRRTRLWWPAQVVDENSINAELNHKKREVGDVVVRLYGTYCYLYTNPSTQGPEFEKDLKRYGISAREAFRRALQKDMAQTFNVQEEKAEMVNDTSTNANGVINDPATERKAQTSKSNPKKRKVPKAALQASEAVAAERKWREPEGLSNVCGSSEIDNPESVKTPSSGIRRTRIMQSLGLIAPSGSPFKLRA